MKQTTPSSQHYTHYLSLLSPSLSLHPAMASSAEKLSLLLLLTLLSSLHTHARDSQFFNKVPSTTNNVVVPNNQKEQQEPNFLPQNENSYGLYGHESGQNPPSTVATTTTTATPEFKQPDHKYLPKNYNPVAYVTQPDDVNENTEETSFTTNPDNNNNYYNNNQQQEGEAEEEAEFRSYPTTTTNGNNGNNYYYNGGSSFNSQPQGQSNRYNGGANGFQPQGMSDTRVIANGKYHYDVGSGRYSSNHPYEALRAQNEFTTRNFYGNNANEFNNRDFSNANEFVDNRDFNNANEFVDNRDFNNANEFVDNRDFNNGNEFNNRNFYGNNANEFQNEGNMP